MFARLIKRFFHDQRGAFAVIFGLLAIVLTAMAGATVDLVTVDQTRNRIQIALDSAALALQPTIYDENKTDTQIKSDIKTTALHLVNERLGDSDIAVTMTDGDVTTDKTEGRLYIKMQVDVPLAFIALLGINDMSFSVASQVTRKKLHIEVAMVLDNSGSMANYSRMTNLKSAASCATNILFYGSCTPAVGATKNLDTKISIVPFNFFVNVGSGNAGASWLDATANSTLYAAGNSSIANDNFDNNDNPDTYTGPVNRLKLYEDMGVSWRGCVEARPGTLAVDDTTPDASNPDTLFVPELAPDEPGGAGHSDPGFANSYLDDFGGSCAPTPTWVHTSTKTNCQYSSSSYSWAYDYCYSSPSDSYVLTHADGTTQTNVNWKPASIDGISPASCSISDSGSGSWYNYTNTRVETCYYGFTDRQRQERMCKYTGTPVSMSFYYGPNAGCPTTSLLPLSDDVPTILSRVNAMVANGMTNIHQGVAWGFRALSPTEPFAEGRAYDSATSKVMIVMTDGENTYGYSSNMNKSSYFTPYGFQYNQRVGNGNESSYQMQLLENQLTLDACTNAKKAGIVIYTIGLNSPNSTTTNMLTSCASEAKNAYFPTQSSELNDVFKAIAEQLAQLRIEK